MRVVHRRADGAEQPQPLADGQPVAVAMLIDGSAFDVLHHQVWQSLLGAAAVQELHDIGVIERRQRLPLVAETTQDFLAVEAGPHNLDGDALAVLVVSPQGGVDDCHAAMPDLVEYSIRTEPSPSHFLERHCRCPLRPGGSATQTATLGSSLGRRRCTQCRTALGLIDPLLSLLHATARSVHCQTRQAPHSGHVEREAS